MRRLAAVPIVFALLGVAFAEEPAAQPPDVAVAVNRGLGFLVKDALAWKSERKCVSCHHAALPVWAMREAKGRRYAVDEPVLAELTRWMAEAGDGKSSLPRPEGIPKALNTKALYFALALGTDPLPDAVSQEGLRRMLETVKEDQLENGAWAAWPETRPPMFGPSGESATGLATLALLPAATAGDEAAKVARDKAVQWFSVTKTDDDPQSLALRLVLWRRLDRPAEEWAPLVERIRQRQNADGGWSQTPDMPSDAWATGQALYALACAGVPATDSAVKLARAFLVSTQRDDGSWPMTSRPSKPGDEGAANLVPITGAGSAWAVLGLVRSG